MRLRTGPESCMVSSPLLLAPCPPLHPPFCSDPLRLPGGVCWDILAPGGLVRISRQARRQREMMRVLYSERAKILEGTRQSPGEGGQRQPGL